MARDMLLYELFAIYHDRDEGEYVGVQRLIRARSMAYAHILKHPHGLDRINVIRNGWIVGYVVIDLSLPYGFPDNIVFIPGSYGKRILAMNHDEYLLKKDGTLGKWVR